MGPHATPLSIGTLPGAALQRIVAQLPPDDLGALRTACSAARAAVSAQRVTTICVTLVPGEARPPDLATRVERCPNAPTLRFITYKGLSPRLAWEHEKAVAELQRHLVAIPCGPAGLCSDAESGDDAAGPEHSLHALAWPHIRRIVDCPAACLEPLARLCPNTEAVSVCACTTGGVAVAALWALGRLTALTQLSVAGPRAVQGGDHMCCLSLESGV